MLNKNLHFHFVGIGGIGMSALAYLLCKKNFQVSGCDIAKSSKILKNLKKIGCIIYQGHNQEHINKSNVIVYSTAITKTNPEIAKAIEKNIPILHRAKLLAQLMQNATSIAITGTHGKTTTTALIAHILNEAQKDPTVVSGGIIKTINSNARIGKSKLFVAEADESDRSLLYLKPSISVLTNIDLEHLNFYKNIDDIKQTFITFINQMPKGGKVFLGIDDLYIQTIVSKLTRNIQTFGFSKNANVRGEIIKLKENSSNFKVYKNDTLLGRLELSLAGKHNVSNALAAIATCLDFKISFEEIKKSLNTFQGIERRFEFKGTYNKAEIFDDYGHHPIEIKHTIEVARKRARNRLIVAFQPHRFTRTQKLWNEFVSTLAYCKANLLYITDIYPASEEEISGISSKNLVNAIKKESKNINVVHIASCNNLKQKLKNILKEGDLILTLGAGSITNVSTQLVTE